MSRRSLIAPTVALLLLLPSPSARAWTVGSAFSDACHERLSAEAFINYISDSPIIFWTAPSGTLWRKVARYVFDFIPQDTKQFSEAQQALLASFLIGVRAPDTEGHSLLTLQSMRQYHADPSPEGQYAHGLRGIEDDGAAGNRRAVEGTRQVIRELVVQAEAYLQRPGAKQYITVPFYLEFYGRVDVPVWAPGYYYARAAHAVQDSFTHMVRDKRDDYGSVVYVMNYLEAINDDLVEERDGLAHSDYRDKCTEGRNPEMVAKAVQATVDFLVAVRMRSRGYDPKALDRFFDRWLTLRDGCTLENSLCDNAKMLADSRRDPTGPYLACGVVPGARPPLGLALLILLSFALRTWRRRGHGR